MKFVIICFACTLMSSLVYADILTMKDFLNLVEKNDPKLKRIFKDKDKLNFIIDQGLANGQILLEIENENSFNSNTSLLTSTLSKNIVESGTKMSISHSKATRPDRKEDVTEIRIEQDLYKNIFGRDVRLKKSALKKEEELIRLEVLESYEDYLSEALIQYLDYQKTYSDLQLANIALRESVRLKKNVQEKRQKKIASQTDLDKTSLQLILRREDLLLKKRKLDQKWEAIKQIIGDSSLKSPSLKLLNNILNFYADSNKKLKRKRVLRSQQIVYLRSEIAKKELDLTRKNRNPSLSLVLGYDIDNSERFLSRVNRSEAIVGLKLMIPIRDKVSNANIKSAALEYSKSELDLEIKQRQLSSQAASLQSRLRELQKKHILLSEKVRLSKRIIRDEKRRYNIGKLDLDRLIEIETDFLHYQFQKQSEELEFAKAIIQWLALSDQLLLFKDRL